jgi:hypothetical protein
MKKSISFIVIFLFGFFILGDLTLIPQQNVYAACYDIKTKTQIPCPKNDPGKSDYSKRTRVPPVPPTITPTLQPTNTPVPTATTFSVQQIVPLVVPLNEKAQPYTCDPRVWPGTAGAGVLLGLTGALAQVLHRRSSGRAFRWNDYSAESHATESRLDVQVGHVDFENGTVSGWTPGFTGPIALEATGIVLVLGSGAGFLNLVPCNVWMGTVAAGMFAGLASVIIGFMFGKGGTRRFMSGKLKVAGNEKLAWKINDDLDEQK